VIGYQQRTIKAGGEQYSWSEYLLFNPYREFRYLTEYAGHWNVVSTINALPETRPARDPSRAVDTAASHVGCRFRRGSARRRAASQMWRPSRLPSASRSVQTLTYPHRTVARKAHPGRMWRNNLEHDAHVM